MRKSFLTFAAAALLSSVTAFPAFAGTWQNVQDGDTVKWWYDNGDGTKALNGWLWIDGDADGIAECYCFDADGWLYVSAVTPDGYTVNELGAWTVDGVVQTQNTALSPSTDTGSSSGWQKIGSDWYYSSGGSFLTSQWKKISGKRYYFDENGVMATGFQEIDGETYYFTSSGALKTKDFTLDGVRYTVEDDGVITDQEDTDDIWDDDDDDDDDSSSKSSSSKTVPGDSDDDDSTSSGDGPSSEVSGSTSYEKPTSSSTTKQSPPSGYGSDRYEEALKSGELDEVEESE